MAAESEARRRIWGGVAGAVLFAAMLAIPAPDGLGAEGWRVAAVAVLMAVLWITEALPLPVTALVPLLLFPSLGVAGFGAAAAPFADPVVFLFLGGFILGAALRRSGLHQRIGLHVVTAAGTSPARLEAGMLAATALVSMWVSNTVTAMIMLPVAVAVIALFGQWGGSDAAARRNFATAMVLAVAYGASIGGFTTLISTPPTALLAAYLAREHGIEISFARWMGFAVPLSLVMLTCAWALLVRLHPAHGGGAALAAAVRGEVDRLGRMSAAERRVGMVFVLAALAWTTRPIYGGLVPAIDDPSIAVIAAVALFVIPSGRPDGGALLDWDDTASLPWGVLLLFGGGLSLAAAISSSGLAGWIGEAASAMAGWPVLAVIAAVTVALVFFTEITSNTASAATFLPVGGALALGLGIEPALVAVPVVLASSCSFMLPVATPPNAIVFASGHVGVAEMARAGFWLDLVVAVLITGAAYLFAGTLFAG